MAFDIVRQKQEILPPKTWLSGASLRNNPSLCWFHQWIIRLCSFSHFCVTVAHRIYHFLYILPRYQRCFDSIYLRWQTFFYSFLFLPFHLIYSYLHSFLDSTIRIGNDLVRKWIAKCQYRTSLKFSICVYEREAEGGEGGGGEAFCWRWIPAWVGTSRRRGKMAEKASIFICSICIQLIAPRFYGIEAVIQLRWSLAF